MCFEKKLETKIDWLYRDRAPSSETKWKVVFVQHTPMTFRVMRFNLKGDCVEVSMAHDWPSAKMLLDAMGTTNGEACGDIEVVDGYFKVRWPDSNGWKNASRYSMIYDLRQKWGESRVLWHLDKSPYEVGNLPSREALEFWECLGRTVLR